MIDNRSIPSSTVIPEVPYRDVSEAAGWLAAVFGFTVRVRIGDHRVQMNVGDGAIVVVEGEPQASRLLVRVENADEHHRRASAAGADVLRTPADHPFGERQYNVRDFAGHYWTFSQSIADVAPEEWGGVTS